MKKFISFLLTAAMVLSLTAGISFAEEQPKAPLSDITGTKYEKAVESLISAGVVNGYEDGTFLPAKHIRRAEAAKLICLAFREKDTPEAGTSSLYPATFKDLDGYGWAAEYIGFCAAKGIVKGDGRGHFRPGDPVTNNEFAAMAVRASGLEKADTAWPEGYVKEAEAAGLLKDLVNVSMEKDGGREATRGNCAIMIFNTGRFPETDIPSVPEEKPEDNKFSDFSGRAFGVVTENAIVLDGDDNVVDCVTFRMGEAEYEFMAKKDVDLPELGPESGIVMLIMDGGRIREAVPVVDKEVYEVEATKSDCLLFEEPEGEQYKGTLQLMKLSAADENGMIYTDSTGQEQFVGMNDRCVVYMCSREDGMIKYTPGIRGWDLRPGSYAAAFTVNSESGLLADIIIAVDESDAEDTLRLDEASGKRFGTLY